MPKFIIEREIPHVGQLTGEQLHDISKKSCGVVEKLETSIQWVESFVTDDKVYCVYLAPDEAAIQQHAEEAGFPANRISQVRQVIDPTTAEA